MKDCPAANDSVTVTRVVRLNKPAPEKIGGPAPGLNCGAGSGSNGRFSGSTEYCGRGDRRILPDAKENSCQVHPLAR
jgi:hypothetical protein